jgi:hypothetical protein
MDPRDIMVAASENQEFHIWESKKSFFGDSVQQINYNNQYDDYSDIYYDKSWINVEEGSAWNFSNFPKEIRLDIDTVSEDDMFLRPNLPDYDYYKLISMNARRSECANLMEIGVAEDVVGQPNGELSLISKYGIATPSIFPTTADNSGDIISKKLDAITYINGDGILDRDELQSEAKFTKNDGKLVFKITRLNKVTQKEQWITKSRRIISKCPHTNMKYYAKGMWKKCYHSYGREKKAFVWGHVGKPLYAKGFWKQCYLSKYKQKTNIKLVYDFIEDGKSKMNEISDLTSNQYGFSSADVEGDLYFINKDADI